MSVPGSPGFGGSQKNQKILGWLGINSTQFSALKTNPGSTHLLNFELDSHRVTHGHPGTPWLWVVSEEPNDIRYVGYQFYSVFRAENESRVNTSLKFRNRLP